jgi:diguanylate cyclase (GGDEF)-like protein
MAGRFGGDEFVVCIRNSDINEPAATAQAILDKLKEGFVCDVGDRLSVNVSIGIAIIQDTAKRVDEIIGMADEAMYNIKKSGKSAFGFIN